MLPARSEVIEPLRIASFTRAGECRERKQGGQPRMQGDLLIFDGAGDGDRQVDPQIAVGGGHVLHATNTGLTIYTMAGECVTGVSQSCFNGGIDPKLFFSPHQRVFGFDLWNPWDEAKQKPVNISISETDDPTGAWNTYPVPAPGGRDGGAIGYSRAWIGYSFPGGDEQTFVLSLEDARQGNPVTVYHFPGNLGDPVQTQDEVDALHFMKLTGRRLIITRVAANSEGVPQAEVIADVPHAFEFFGWPPAAPQSGTEATVAAGDRRPKNIVLQGGFLWFSHTVNVDGRAGVQWHQLKPDGTLVQSGRLSDPQKSFIQTTIAVNRQLDVLVGFQECGPDQFVSPRLAWRKSDDPPGTLRDPISLGQGQAATAGGPWGDYSGSVVDGDNGLDLWTVQSIAGADGRGDCIIARLPIQ